MYLNRLPAQDTVSDDGVNLGCATFDQVLGCKTDSATGVCHVVDQDSDLALNRSDENHSRLCKRKGKEGIEQPLGREESDRKEALTTSLAFFRSLWKSAKSTFSRSAIEVALYEAREQDELTMAWESWRKNDETDRFAPPASGETMMQFLTSILRRM